MLNGYGIFRLSCVAAALVIGTIVLRKFPGKKSLLKPAMVRFRVEDLINETSVSSDCTVDTCVDLLPCSVYDNRLTVYLEPLTNVIDQNGVSITPKPSKEYLRLRSTIEDSVYYVGRIEDACLVVPGFDTLNLHRFGYQMGLRHAIDAGGRAQTSDPSFRNGYDVAMPLWIPDTALRSVKNRRTTRPWHLTVLMKGLEADQKEQIAETFRLKSDVLLLNDCDNNTALLCYLDGRRYRLDDALKESNFAVVFDQNTAFEWILMSAVRCGTVPVIISDHVILPFDDVIDWNRLSFSFYGDRLSAVYDILKTIEPERLVQMRLQGQFIYRKYFFSLEAIVLTTLKIIQNRVVTNSLTFKSEWNGDQRPPPLFLPRVAPPEGFTAVIITEGDTEVLFAWLLALAKAPNLVSIVIVWNIQYSLPPQESDWPRLGRKIYLIRPRKARPSNRFVNYNEIGTEAVLSVRDTDETLTPGEIEFGYQLWRENPHQIIRYSMDANSTQRSNVSSNSSVWGTLNAQLHGSFFYHKYYGVLYHKTLSERAKELVDSEQFCEDTAMNHFVSHFSAGTVVNVHRKKILCQACTYGKRPFWINNFVSERFECAARMELIFGDDPRCGSVNVVHYGAKQDAG